MDEIITLRGIVTCIRHFGADAAKPAALCAAETMGDFITGFGMAGGELVGRPTDYAYAFDMAREAGLALTCHAGEWGGPDMVAETLDALKVSRIGHGINARHDPKVIDQIIETGTVLEVCPISNMVLHAIPPDQKHPIGQLIDAGVKVTVSTDAPPFFASDRTAEFYYLATLLGFVEVDFVRLN
jgi:adenosine deaminase